MMKHRLISQVCRFTLGAALVASATLTSGLAKAESVICTASGPGGSRQLAELRESSRDPSYCIRVKLGGYASSQVPDCWKAAREAGLSCVNEDGSVNIVDL